MTLDRPLASVSGFIPRGSVPKARIDEDRFRWEHLNDFTPPVLGCEMSVHQRGHAANYWGIQPTC